MITLETPRLLLRPLTLDDTPALFRVTGDAEVMHYWTTGPDRTVAEARGRLLVNQAHVKEHGFGDWAVLLKPGRKFIGFCGMQHQRISGRERVGLGYALDKAFWGMGYGSEAGRCVIDYAFSNLQLDEVIATVDANNVRSLKVLDHCGFVLDHEGTFDGLPRLIYRTVGKKEDLDL